MGCQEAVQRIPKTGTKRGNATAAPLKNTRGVSPARLHGCSENDWQSHSRRRNCQPRHRFGCRERLEKRLRTKLFGARIEELSRERNSLLWRKCHCRMVLGDLLV